MSDRKEHEPVAAAKAARTKVMKAIRKQADEAVGQLMQDVSRLIDDAYRDIGRIPESDPSDPYIPDPPIPDPPIPDPPLPDDPPIPDPPVPDPPLPEEEEEKEMRRERRHLDAELHAAVVDIVRAEIAALDPAALVKAELDRQLRAFTNQLQERLKANAKPGLQKLSPLLSRRRR